MLVQVLTVPTFVLPSVLLPASLVVFVLVSLINLVFLLPFLIAVAG